MTEKKFQTTFRQLLKIPNISIGLGAYKWRVYEDVIRFEDIEYGAETEFHIDTPLTVYNGLGDDTSGVFGIRHDNGKKDGMTVAIIRPLTPEDLNTNL